MNDVNIINKAIEDAKALKELAYKSAERTILENLKPEVKTIAQKLLEQNGINPDEEEMDNEFEPDSLDAEEDPLAGLGLDSEDTMGSDMNDADAEFMDTIPQSATDGEKLCTCPDETKEGNSKPTTVSLDQLVNIAEAEINKAIMREKKLIETMVNGEDDEQSSATPGVEGFQGELEQESITMPLDKLTELVTALTEEIVFNYNFQPTGHIGHPTDKELAEFEELNKVINDLKSDKEKGEKEKENLEKNNKSLSEKYSIVIKNNQSLKEKAKNRIKELKSQLNEKIEENLVISMAFNDMEVENGKLFYINKALMKENLNKKQKLNIINTINECKTVDEVVTSYNSAIKLVENVGARRSDNRSMLKNKSTLAEVKASINQSRNIVESASATRLTEAQRVEKNVQDRNMRLAGINPDDE